MTADDDGAGRSARLSARRAATAAALPCCFVDSIIVRQGTARCGTIAPDDL